MEDLMRGMLAELNTLKAKADAYDELHHKVEALQKDIEASNATHTAELISLRVMMSGGLNTELPAEVGRLQAEVGRLQLDSVRAKESLKRMQASTTEHTNDLIAHKGQLSRIETKISGFEIESIYNKPASLDHEPETGETQLQGDHDQVEHHVRSDSITHQAHHHVRSDSATLQGSPNNKMNVSHQNSKDPQHSIALSGPDGKRKLSPLELFTSGSFKKRAKQEHHTPLFGGTENGSEESPTSDDSDIFVPNLPSGTLPSNTANPREKDLPNELVPSKVGDQETKANKKGIAKKTAKEPTRSVSRAPDEPSTKSRDNQLTSDIVATNGRSSAKAGSPLQYTGYKSRASLLPDKASATQAGSVEQFNPGKEGAAAKGVGSSSIKQATEPQTVDSDSDDIVPTLRTRSGRSAQAQLPAGHVRWVDVPKSNLGR